MVNSDKEISDGSLAYHRDEQKLGPAIYKEHSKLGRRGRDSSSAMTAQQIKPPFMGK